MPPVESAAAAQPAAVSRVGAEAMAPWEAPSSPPSGVSEWTMNLPSRILQLLAARDTTGAQRECDQLQASARSAAERDKHRHCQLVLAEIVAFWNAYERSLAELQVGDVIFYRGTPVVVQLLTAEQVTLAAGSGHTRGFSISKATASLDLACGIAERGGATPAMIAAAKMAEHQPVSAAEAGELERLWEAGPQANLRLEGRPSSPVAPPAMPSDRESDATGEKRFPPPTADALAAAEAIIDSNYRSELRDASPRARRDLANELLSKSRQPGLDVAQRYAFLDRSREIAASAGDIELAWKLLLEMHALFEIDVNTVTTTISLLNRRLQDPGVVLQLLERCELLVDQCIDARAVRFGHGDDG